MEVDEQQNAAMAEETKGPLEGVVNEAQNQESINQMEQMCERTQVRTGAVSVRDFRTLSVIGKGSYGKVLLVEKVDTGKMYALKILKKNEILRRNQFEHTMDERRILESVNHDNIVRMDFAFQTENKLYFCLEYCPGGELFFYLSQIGRFKQDAAKFYAANILLALQHLHSLDILYRDLKPENVLVDGQGYIKLTDFGLSKMGIQGHREAKSLCGTAEYLSPEMLQRQGHGKATDWWSFGAIIYEMLVGLPPFYSKDREKLYQNIKYAEPRLDYAFLTNDARDLCTRLLHKDPGSRLGSGPTDAEEIKAHPWFEAIDWEAIKNRTMTPPYKPQLDQADDTKHFLPEFTNLQPSPQEEHSLPEADGDKFLGFSYDGPSRPINSRPDADFQMSGY